jgi:hypothetical protein
MGNRLAGRPEVSTPQQLLAQLWNILTAELRKVLASEEALEEDIRQLQFKIEALQSENQASFNFSASTLHDHTC